MKRPLPAEPGTRRKAGLILFLSCLAILLFTFAPLISALTAGAVADANGCVLNEGGTYPCVIAGTDIGALLAAMFVSGWLMFFTFPIGALALIVWCVFLAIIILFNNTRKKT